MLNAVTTACNCFFDVIVIFRDVWQRDRPTYVYGGVRVLPMRGMERSLQSTFPRIQVALRRSMHDFQVMAFYSLCYLFLQF